MNLAVLVSALCGAFLAFSQASASSGPADMTPAIAIPAPKDRAYAGEIRLAVDATDLERRIVHVHEILTGVSADTILLYPKWQPGDHAPSGPIDRLAGLKITSGGAPVPWTRDPVDVYAFRLHPGAAARSVDIEFDYLSPTSPKVGPAQISRDLLLFEWNQVVLYPAGVFARQIPVEATVSLPAGWQFGTALETVSANDAHTIFKPTDLETLIDSPVYAGRYARRFDLDPGGSVPAHLDLFADRPELLVVTEDQLQAHRMLLQQAYKLFGSHHFSHYDFLYSLSDQIENKGLEHHQSSENGTDPDSFTKWDEHVHDRDLLPHEFAHSWNGKFRRPADLWTPNYNVPMQDSLLWVYEGQTQYWGQVLAARSGLWSRQQALDEMAYTAAYYQLEMGRQWRPLEDTTNDEIINPRRPQSWADWQRFEDYYEEGKLIWLEADTLIREQSGGKRSLDDFARAFFGINDGSVTPVTYTVEDVIKALNAVQPYDWATFLRRRVNAINKDPPLEGLTRGGYSLVYTDAPSAMLAASDTEHKRVDLSFSIGIEIDDEEKSHQGMLKRVVYNGAAFKAQITEGGQILAVNGIAYDPDVLKDAIRAAKGDSQPIELIVRTGDRYRVARVDYHDGLRYPHLERQGNGPALLDEILTPRP